MKPLPLARPVGIRRIMKVCSWCPPALRQAQENAIHRMGGLVSHGICADCAEKVRREIGLTLRVDSPGISYGTMPAPSVNAFRGVES
jgi:hypothetical protein